MTIELFERGERFESEWLQEMTLRVLSIEEGREAYAIVICPPGCSPTGRRTFTVPRKGHIEITAEPEVEF